MEIVVVVKWNYLGKGSDRIDRRNEMTSKDCEDVKCLWKFDVDS